MRTISGELKLLLVLFLLFAVLRPVSAFGAGNIASISKIEGKNWRHGDIEDMLKTVAFLRGRKWSSMMVKRVYFGNWLRDYSQAMDVGTLQKVQAESIRILVWVLAFLSFGYATEEFEVTKDRLGVYRPEEHIDNPRDYADNEDARKFDERLRPPIDPIELAIDPNTGMKNYIANESLNIATSAGYVKYSLSRSIHYGRVYTNGSGGTSGKEDDLYEALRCLGQALHCMEDFGAHSNYVELALREQGYRNVFPHTGTNTQINLRGQYVFPLITGTFGMVDFIHSVLGEATDHFTQSQVDETNPTPEVEKLNQTLLNAQTSGKTKSVGDTSRSQLSTLTGLLSQVPGCGDMCKEAEQLQAASMEQERLNEQTGMYSSSRAGPNEFPPPPGSQSAPAAGGPAGGIPGMSASFDPVSTAKKIYPILEFRDKIAKAIAATIEKIPGLEALVEKITETITLFILSLLAPFVRPIIDAVSKSLKQGSMGVVDASGKHQYEPWTDPNCTDPTHSLLSKDHFSNILNEPAGKVASSILQYTVPRVLYAMEHPDISVDQVLNDVLRAFHHPAIRDRNCEIHNNMFNVVDTWARGFKGHLDQILSSQSVREGHNHVLVDEAQGMGHGFHSHGGQAQVPGYGQMHIPGYGPGHGGQGGQGHGGQGYGGHGQQGGHSQGQGFLGNIPGMNQLPGGLGSTLQSAAGRLGGGNLDKLAKLGKKAGLTRGDEDFEAEAAKVDQYYPGTDPRYDPQPGGYPQHEGRTPSPHPNFPGYAAPGQPPVDHYGYGPQNLPQDQNYSGSAPQWQHYN